MNKKKEYKIIMKRIMIRIYKNHNIKVNQLKNNKVNLINKLKKY